MSNTKRCARCGDVKSVSDFSRRGNSNYLQSYCKQCRATQRKEKFEYKRPGSVIDGKKTCSYCKQFKPTSEFAKSKKSKSGLTSACKSCRNVIAKKCRSTAKYTVTVQSKICKMCNTEKSASDFSKNKANADGLHTYCKSCRTSHGVSYHKDRLSYDDLYKLKTMLRTRLNCAIKDNFKGGSAVRDLGCSIDYFKEYISSKFVDGMNWNNRGNGDGKWHLDHIKPLSYFDLSDPEDCKEALHYTNYQPLWSCDNLSKSDKLDWGT